METIDELHEDLIQSFNEDDQKSGVQAMLKLSLILCKDIHRIADALEAIAAEQRAQTHIMGANSIC